MGKLISVYLNTDELEQIESLCEKNPDLNTHKTIKMALDQFLISKGHWKRSHMKAEDVHLG